MALVNITLGTQVSITDRGWLASGGFVGGEGLLSWTATDTFPEGTVVRIDLSTGTASEGLLEVVTTLPSLSIGGDQLFLFQGSPDAPRLIFALQNNGNTWQADATSLSTSADPPLPENAKLALQEVDNAAYNGIKTGTRDELLAAITTRSNWMINNREAQFVTEPFEVLGESVPSPCPCRLAEVLCRIRNGCFFNNDN